MQQNYFLILGILLYIFFVVLLVWSVNKIQKDSKSIMIRLSENLNAYFFIINQYIALHRTSLEKLDDLVDVLYAKKKRFLHNKTHVIADQYELFLGLKDSIEYLSDYSGDELNNEDLYKETESLFSFLFSIKSWQV
jgi:hypothetical protein